jgi:hypothetical protein
MIMRNVKICPISGYFVTLHDVNCCITVLQQCKCNCNFYHISFLSIYTYITKYWGVKRKSNVEQIVFTKNDQL